VPQFFIKTTDIIQNRCRIAGDDFRHLTAARRVKPGDTVQLRIETGSRLSGRVLEISDSFVELAVIGEAEHAPPAVEITLCASLLKGKSFDSVVEKAVEIGVSRIVPVVTERTIPHPPDAQAKLVRWRRKALEAAKQSMRESVPDIERIHSFKEAIDARGGEVRIIAHPGAEASIKDFLRRHDPGAVTLLVGPEGGFSMSEVEEAVKAGWSSVNFGFSQLRAGTAAVVLCGILMYEWGMEA
jgi:16S rRNA (uracil1498-N3)-methyltransferase